MTSTTSTRVARRHGAFPALIATAAIVLAILLQRVIGSLLSSLFALSYIDLNLGESAGSYFSQTWLLAITQVASTAIPFGVGAFLAFWLVAPIAPQLRISHVITRAGLATVFGAIAAALFGILLAFIVSMATAPSYFGNSFPFNDFVASASQILSSGAAAGVSAFVDWLPHTILGAVLLWIWLTHHPAKHPVSGIVDEV